jgi:phosphoadenosine phosphosulfate reductase
MEGILMQDAVKYKLKNSIYAFRESLKGLEPNDIILWAWRVFGKRVAFASSLGLEDQVLTDMIAKSVPELTIFTLDTGRLFPETYELIQTTTERYGLQIWTLFPDTAAVEEMVNAHGIGLFRKSVEFRKRCCRIRKIEPLRRVLSSLDAWICGLRREQSPDRTDVEIVEWDEVNGLIKINPLAGWLDADVREYIRKHNVPHNPLHDKGFPSIGCACCTRAVNPGEDPRAGRWWWETEIKKECGLHWKDGKPVACIGNKKADAISSTH